VHRTPTTDQVIVNDPESGRPVGGTDGSFDPWGGRLERTLRLAIPSLVHRLNNALGPVTGFTSVAVRSKEALAVDRAAVVSEQAERAVALTRALSEVSKRPDGDAEPTDLVEWLRETEDFLDGCVEGFAAGVRLRLQPRSAAVRVSTRSLFQLLFVGLVEAADAGARDLEIALVSDGANAVVLELRALHLGAPLPTSVAELAGASFLEHDAHAQRLRFAALAPVAVDAAAGAGPLVVVVERDPFLRDELEHVLIEQDYRVAGYERVSDVEMREGDTPNAYLIDSVAASTPAIGDLLDRAPAPLCVLGATDTALDPHWPHLAKPFRPGELLERVAGLVAR